MTSKQEGRVSMFMAARDYLIANAIITATLPNYAAFFAAVQTGIISIQSIREQQEFDKTGITANKNQLKNTLIQQAIDVARKLAAYAGYINNTVLQNEIKYTESDLRKSSDTILKDRCQVIYDRANANVAALSTYGITAAILTSLQTTINNYNAAIPKPRLGINEKKQATTQLTTLIETVDSNLEKIDSLVEIVRTTQVNFYNGYKNARKVILTGNGSLALRGSAIDSGNGEPIANAVFTFILETSALKTLSGKENGNGNGNGHIIKKTAAKGIFNIKSMPEGNYNVIVKKPGYKDKTMSVSVTDGELSELEVEMEKL
jgi:hypothetical protein